MGRTTVEDIAQRVERKTAPIPAPAPPAPPAPVAPPALSPAKARKAQMGRLGLTYTGYYINHQAKEQIRELHYRTRREKQDLFREALNLLFEKYDMDPVTYPSKSDDGEQSENL